MEKNCQPQFFLIGYGTVGQIRPAASFCPARGVIFVILPAKYDVRMKFM